MQKFLFSLSLSFFCFVQLSHAQNNTEFIIPDTITVGIKPLPPFVIDNADSVYSGISILFFEKVAEDLNLAYKYKLFDNLNNLLDAVAAREVDLAVGALSITDEREARLDFTHSYFSSGMGVAMHENKQGIFAQLLNIASWDFVKAAGVLCFVILIFGFLLWLFERKKNREMFGKGSMHGIGSSFWWSAVTMTTVGYGDKAPITPGGRVIAFVWMFTAIVITSTLTAAIASSLTINTLSQNIESIEDLANVKVGTVLGSNSEEYLNREGIIPTLFDDTDSALQALQNEEVKVVIYDRPILQYLINHSGQYEDLEILPNRILPSSYGFALPENSPLRNELNIMILRKLTSPEYRSIINRYIGREIID